MSEDEKENTFYNILNAPIYTYRLTDGSYIVAEEIQRNDEVEEEDEEEVYDVLLCLMPGLINCDDQGFSIRPWNITTTSDLTEILYSNVVSRSEATPEVKLKYFELIVGNKNVEPTRDEAYLADLLEEFKETFVPIDAIDNQDSSPSSDRWSKRWDWDPKLN